jgi:hypothetical protein
MRNDLGLGSAFAVLGAHGGRRRRRVVAGTGAH